MERERALQGETRHDMTQYDRAEDTRESLVFGGSILPHTVTARVGYGTIAIAPPCISAPVQRGGFKVLAREKRACHSRRLPRAWTRLISLGGDRVKRRRGK